MLNASTVTRKGTICPTALTMPQAERIELWSTANPLGSETLSRRTFQQGRRIKGCIPQELAHLDELFKGGHERRLTRSQKRENRKQYTPLSNQDQELSRHALDTSPEEIKAL